MSQKYTQLISEYPQTVTLDQLYKICRISKRKGRWLLENGIIPCKDTGGKTHRFQIQLADIVRFLKDRDAGLLERQIPSGIFSNRKSYQKTAPIPVDEQHFEKFLNKEWSYLTDALTAGDAARLLGYHCTSVNDWAAEKKLPAIDYYGKTIIAKEHLIQFISQTVNRDREDKSEAHLRLVERFFQHEKVSELLGNSYSSTSLIEGGD